MNLRGVASGIAREDGFFAVVQARAAEVENIFAKLRQADRIPVHSMRTLQDAIFFEHIKNVVIPAVFADQASEFRGGVGGVAWAVGIFAGVVDRRFASRRSDLDFWP